MEQNNTQPTATAPKTENKAGVVQGFQNNPHAPRTFTRNHFGGDKGGARGGSRGGPRKGGPREARVRPEYDHKILNIRRVTRVSSGGRRFNFSVALIIGNRKGSIGVGLGKAGDTAAAIDKAMRNAKKNLINITLTKKMSLPHEVSAKYCSARLMIMPAPGRGIIAGSAVRNIIELAGIKDVTAKILSGSKNQLNIARAAVSAFGDLRKPVQAVVKAEAKKEETKTEKAK